MKKTIAFALAVAVAMTLFGIFTFAEGTGKPVVTVSEDGLHKTVDFTAMEVTDTVLGAIEAADIGAVDMDVNYQIAFYDGANVFYTVNGYDPAWVIYEVDAPVGQVLDTLKLKIVGRIADYGPVANAFAVFARDDGFDGEANACELNMIAADSRQPEDWEDYAYYVMQANHGTMPPEGNTYDVHEFDLSEVAKGAKVMYVAIYQYTTNCPEWICYRSLSIDATAVDKEEPATEAPSEPTEAPAETEPPAEEPTTAPEATEVPKETGIPTGDPEPGKKGCGGVVAVPSAFAVLALAACAAFVRKKR